MLELQYLHKHLDKHDNMSKMSIPATNNMWIFLSPPPAQMSGYCCSYPLFSFHGSSAVKTTKSPSVIEAFVERRPQKRMTQRSLYSFSLSSLSLPLSLTHTHTRTHKSSLFYPIAVSPLGLYEIIIGKDKIEKKRCRCQQPRENII